jgi:NADH-quinone oxidoreductase subunit H
MENLSDLARYFHQAWELSPFWAQIVSAILILIAAVVVFLVALLFGGVLTWLERRVSGRAQSRVGPNRVGPIGILQWLADGLKLIMKEDTIPTDADRPLFRLAPYAAMIGVFAAFATIPFSQLLIAADLNVGLVYLLAITSLVVVSTLMAGWSSNNKWSLLGGIRAAAQIVSYEIPAALSLMVIVLIAGTLSMQELIVGQGGWPWQWYIFHNPFTFVAFFTYFIAAIAEGNRIPFDLPEAESELVAGYNTEYSGMRFAGFFLAEFTNIYLMSAIATAVFFGGWQIPGISPTEQASSWLLQLTGLVIFVAKAWVGCFVVLWMRWTLPRMRVDQLMSLCYRYLIPIAFVCLMAVAVYLLVIPKGSTIDQLIHLATAGLGGLVVAIFFWRVIHHARSVGDKLSPFELLQRGKKYKFDPSVQVRRYGAHRKEAR